jgi:hypothetical protein
MDKQKWNEHEKQKRKPSPDRKGEHKIKSVLFVSQKIIEKH